MARGSAVLSGCQAIARLVCRALARMEVHGVPTVPADGPVVLLINHRSLMDGVIVFGEIRRVSACLVKAEAFRGPLAWVLRGCGQIPVRRGSVDPTAVHRGVRLLRAGGVLGVFPESTRGDGLVRHAKPGAGYFALRSGAAAVPVALHGTPQMIHRRSLRRPTVRMVVGPAMAVERFADDRILPRRTVAVTTERLRAELAQLVADTGTGHD
jgi:1-acyl-sn-glycerol-3-phosphate acyltransferase